MNIVYVVTTIAIIVLVIRIVKAFLIARTNTRFAYSVYEGDLDTAKQYFKVMLTLKPDTFGRNPIIHLASLNMSQLHSSLPRERLLDFFASLSEFALDYAPHSPYSYLMNAGIAKQRQAEQHELQEQLNKAIGLTTSANDIDVLVFASHINDSIGNFSNARDLISQAIPKLQAHKGSNEELSQLIMLQAHALAKCGNHSKAIEALYYCIKIIENPFMQAQIFLNLSNEYTKQGQYLKAVAVLERSLLLSYDNDDVKAFTISMLFHPLLFSLYMAGRENELEIWIKKLSAHLAPIAILLGRAYLYALRGEAEKAKDSLREALQEGPRSVLALMEASQVYRLLDAPGQALSLLEQASKSDLNLDNELPLDLSDNNVFTPRDMRSIRMQVSHFPYSINSLCPNSINILLAEFYAELKRYDDALIIYKRMVRETPNNGMFQLYYARTLIADGQREAAECHLRQAERFLEQTLEQTSQNYEFNFGLAQICYLDGDDTRALAHGLLATQIEPGHYDAHELLGDILQRLNLLTDAVKSWETSYLLAFYPAHKKKLSEKIKAGQAHLNKATQPENKDTASEGKDTEPARSEDEGQ